MSGTCDLRAPAQRGDAGQRPRFELMPLIDNRRSGAEAIVGWATRCLRCPAPVHKTETTTAAEAWMARHRERCPR